MNNPIITIAQGPLFTSSMRGVIGIIGILSAISLIGLPLAILCLAAFTYMGGTQIKIEERLFREYGSSLGLKWGKWRSLDVYSSIVILSTRRISSTYSRSDQAISEVEFNYDVVFVNNTHRKKYLIKAFNSMNEAKALAQEISALTQKPLERYAPKRISTRR